MGTVATFPVLEWTDGSTVHSVVLLGADGLEHEYWVTRAGEVIAKCPSLTAVDDWRAARD
jgi:hypothetical protein